MSTPPEVFHAYCACGRTEFQATGSPMLVMACYCDDCQAANAQINAMPNGHGGARSDGGTPSTVFRKDRVRCVRGQELLNEHKLRPDSHTSRVIATCCNSNMETRFDNWYPFVALRTHSVNTDDVKPQLCMNTKWAPNKDRIMFQVPHHAGIPLSFAMKLLGASVQLGFQRAKPMDQIVT